MTDDVQVDLFTGETEICTVEKDPERSGLEAMDDNRMQLYREKTCKMIAYLSELGLPEPGQQFRLVTRRTFNAIQMLEFIARDDPIEDLKMAIYSINFEAAKSLMLMVQTGKIKQCEILMSNLRNKAHREKEEIIKNMFTDHPRISLFYCSSHAKTMSCRTRSGQHYSIEGSGNLAYNSRVEQYIIDNCETVYRFHCQWMADIREFLKGSSELEEC